MYPLGKNQYPTLVQKHFNGAAPCQINFVNLIWLLSELDNHQARWFLLEKCKCEEAAVLAKWLKGVTLSVAHITGTEHAMLPAIFDIGSLRCLFFFWRSACLCEAEVTSSGLCKSCCNAFSYGKVSQWLCNPKGTACVTVATVQLLVAVSTEQLLVFERMLSLKIR